MSHSIYAAWHIEIASSSHFVASSQSVVVGVCHRNTFYFRQYLENGLSDLIKRIARDACLCMGDLQAPPAPPAPAAPYFVFLITL